MVVSTHYETVIGIEVHAQPMGTDPPDRSRGYSRVISVVIYPLMERNDPPQEQP